MQANKVTVIDAKDLILGRMASIVAKRLLENEAIIIVNAEKAVISGKKKNTVSEAKEFLDVGHPTKGPYHYRTPDRIVRRTIRRMLPHKKPKGRNAYKRLRVNVGLPEELGHLRAETLVEAQAKKLKCTFITVGLLAKEIGWNLGG